MKNVTRNKLLLCFRPVVMEVDLEEPDSVDCSTDKTFTYITVESNEDMKISTMETSSLSGKDCSKISEEIVRRSPKRTFSRILKAVLFQTSLSKAARDRKVRQDSCGSKSSSNLSAKSDTFFDVRDDKLLNKKSSDSDIREIKTNSMLSSSSSSSSSSFSSSSSSSQCPISESNIPNSCINPKQNMGWSSLNSGLYLLLISLTVTILWGRLCAILFTSIWLYFLPQRNVGERQSENVSKRPEIEFRNYKKRVIMEGLLERNHHKGH